MVDEKLEADVLARRDAGETAEAAYQVYADWLTSQGDPHGELVALAVAGGAGYEKAFDKLKVQLLGELPDKEDIAKLEWKFGFIDKARLRAEDGHENLADVYRAFMAVPAARLCRNLTLGAAVYADENHYGEVVEAMAELGVPPGLRRLFIGDFNYEESELSWSILGDIGGLWAKWPALTSLKIRMGSQTLGEIVAPELINFEIETGGLPKAECKSICEARWPKLTSLSVYFGQDNYGGDCTVDDVMPILDGKGLGGVTSLGLCNHEFADSLAEVIHKARILPQLKTLDLSKGTMSDDGARALLANRAAFAHLDELDLSENYVSADLAAQLATLCKSVQHDMRDDEDPEYRYTVVGE
jgi:hypothetical protein